MPSDSALSHAADLVRHHDRDRFVTALFAPAEARERLMLLYAFNVEVARVQDVVHEPMAGVIRLQWWREALAGERMEETASHPVAGPLLDVCRTWKVNGESFERLLEARESDLASEPPSNLEAYAADTAGALCQLALELLDIRDPRTLDAGRAVGTAYALVGLLRAVPFHRARGREWVVEAEVQPVADRARQLLAEARQQAVDRRGVPALLSATLASGYLKTLEKSGWNVFDARVAQSKRMPLRLAVNALRGRF